MKPVSIHIHNHDGFEEGKHPRANNGEFSSGGGLHGSGHKTHAVAIKSTLQKLKTAKPHEVKALKQRLQNLKASQRKLGTMAGAAEKAQLREENEKNKSKPISEKEKWKHDIHGHNMEEVTGSKNYQRSVHGESVLVEKQKRAAYFNTSKGEYAPNTAATPNHALESIQTGGFGETEAPKEKLKLKQVGEHTHHVVGEAGERHGDYEIHSGNVGYNQKGQTHFSHGGQAPVRM